VARKSTAVRFALLVTVALLVLAVAGAAQAGNGKPAPGGGGGSSLSLKMVSDVNGNGLPNYGDTVTFSVSTTATTEPHVSLACYQNGTQVYSAVTGYYASYPWLWTQNMPLWSSNWTGGAADCTATLYYFSGRKTITLTTLGFHVDA
jgi:hypothetical protein